MSSISAKYYASDDILKIEQSLIFKTQPIYIGCKQMVPNYGDFYVSSRDTNRYVLIHNQLGIQSISNICRHHQAILLQNRGNISHILCPFHFWKYDLDGSLIKAPHFEEKPCDGLKRIEIFSWKNLFFKNQSPLIDIPENSLLNNFSFDDYQFFNTLELQANYNWKIFIDNYLDDLHIPSIHPGLRCMVDMQTLQWEAGKGFNIQKLQLKKEMSISKSESFNNWAKAIIKIKKNFSDVNLYPVSWIHIYPNTMIEVYPYMITISTVNPIDAQRTVNHVDFLYPKTILEDFPEYPAISQASYLEKALEDDRLCESIHLGKKVLFDNDEEDKGISHRFLEKGIYFFHQYYKDLIK